MRAVIISGGKISDYDYIKEKILQFGADLIICADSGYNHAVKMKLDVNLVAGDFDSLAFDENIPDNIKTVRYPSEKNQTDTEIALAHVRETGARDILIVGATGTRADHTLTNIFMLKSCLGQAVSAEILDEFNRIRIIDTRLEIKGSQGDIISLVPLSDCAGVTIEGVKYPLHKAELQLGEGLGVSNVIMSEIVLISVDKGLLLVIETRD
jgi:thiamine pyrophosphokinase